MGLNSTFTSKYSAFKIAFILNHSFIRHVERVITPYVLVNIKLASCPWRPATAHGVGLLTETYVIYMETCTSHRAMLRPRSKHTFMPKIMFVGPTAAAEDAVTDAMTES